MTIPKKGLRGGEVFVPVPKKIVHFLIHIYNIFIVNKFPTQTWILYFLHYSKHEEHGQFGHVFCVLAPLFHSPSTQIQSTWLIWPSFLCLGFNIPNMKGVAIFGHTFHVSSSFSLPSPPRHEMRPFLALFLIFWVSLPPHTKLAQYTKLCISKVIKYSLEYWTWLK